MPDSVYLFLGKSVGLVHVLFILFFVFGWLLPPDFLMWHIISIPIVMIHWKLNNDQCILTQLQMRLEGTEISLEDEGQFIKSLLKKIGKEPHRDHLLLTIYGLLIASGLISSIRLWS